jgi:hypothetical protein
LVVGGRDHSVIKAIYSSGILTTDIIQAQRVYLDEGELHGMFSFGDKREAVWSWLTWDNGCRSRQTQAHGHNESRQILHDDIRTHERERELRGRFVLMGLERGYFEELAGMNGGCCEEEKREGKQ